MFSIVADMVLCLLDVSVWVGFLCSCSYCRCVGALWYHGGFYLGCRCVSLVRFKSFWAVAVLYAFEQLLSYETQAMLS